MNPIFIGGAILLLTMIAGASGSGPTTPGPTPETPRPTPEAPGPTTPPRPSPKAERNATGSYEAKKALSAYIKAVAQQGIQANSLSHLINKNLVLKGRVDYSAVLLPCDQIIPGQLPTPDLLHNIAAGIAESYEVCTATFPLAWNHPTTGSIAMCAITFYAPGAPVPNQFDVISRFTAQLSSQTEQFGSSYGFIDLIVNTMISSAVGTVTSMGVQDLVHSAGGEQKLARLVRNYKAAKARGGAGRASHLLKKITRVASRIKGRDVNWGEVDALISQEYGP